MGRWFESIRAHHIFQQVGTFEFVALELCSEECPQIARETDKDVPA
jgi:hypothetical protein